VNRPKFGSQKEGSFGQKKREEVGAIWKKTIRESEDMLNIRLTKSKIKELLNSPEDEVRLVAFTNKTTNDKQPNFRIYKDNN
jgi:uncharacterized protein (DUF736 family)